MTDSMLKISVKEPDNKIRNLLQNAFADQLIFDDETPDIRIEYYTDLPQEFTDGVIYLSSSPIYGNPAYAGKFFARITYEKIEAQVEDNDYFIKEFLYYFKTKFLKEYSIAFAEVALTTQCNLKCEHCCVDHFRPVRPINIRYYKQFLDDFKQQGGMEVTFTGGEPTLQYDLLKSLIVYCTSIGLDAGMITNGTMLNKDKLEDLKQVGIQYIFVSLYGSESNHDKFTAVAGSYERSLQTLKAARDAGINTMISTVATCDSLRNGDIGKLLELASREHVRVYINDVVPVGNYADKEIQSLPTPEKDLLQQYMQLDMVKKNEKYFYGYTGVCNQMRRRLYVSAFGDVCPCPYIQISFGNIEQQRLDEIKDNVIKSGYLNQPYRAGCLAAQSRGFMETFLKPIHADKPIKYTEHPWFKGKTDDL